MRLKTFFPLVLVLAAQIVAGACWAQATPGFSTTPASPIDLGPSAVGVATPHASELAVRINNPGTAQLNISSFSFNPPEMFFTAETLFPGLTSIPAGEARDLSIQFQPQAAGPRTIQFTTIDDAPGSPHVVEFTGTGVAVPANDFEIILDPGVTSPVSVTAGGSFTFPVWFLAGPGLVGTNMNPPQCSGGPVGTTCAFSDTAPMLVGDSFSETRDKEMVTVSIPAKSASFHSSLPLWTIAASTVFGVFYFRRRAAISYVGVLLLGLFLVSCGGGSRQPVPTGSNSLLITVTPRTGTAHSLTVPLAIQ